MSDPKGATSEVSELVDLLKRYVLQETIGPLKTMGRSLGFGAAAAIMFGIGATFALIGVLRVLESETGTVFGGDLSWAPYALTSVACIAVIGLAAGLLVRPPRSERARRSGSAVSPGRRQEAR